MTSNKKVSYSRHSLIENYSQKKLVYLYSKEQHKDPEQQKLFMTALECSSKCMYPFDFKGKNWDTIKQHGKEKVDNLTNSL